MQRLLHRAYLTPYGLKKINQVTHMQMLGLYPDVKSFWMDVIDYLSSILNVQISYCQHTAYVY